MLRFLKIAFGLSVWLVALGCTAWAYGALAFDFPWAKSSVAIGYLVVVVLALAFTRGLWRKWVAMMGMFTLVLIWWFSQQPRQNRDWQPDVAETAWADVKGDEVTFYNVRNCEYRTEHDYTPRWETRTVKLSSVTGLDIALGYWGSEWMAHPIVSFQFSDAPPLCFSIETRKEKGESYSAIGGIYRQYELIYLVADERDVIRVRTNYRPGEDIYLYHTTVSPEIARSRLMEYIRSVNELHQTPRWYNAITTNCTTAIRSQHPAEQRAPFDWRMLVNGKSDEMLYERGGLDRSKPFPELKKSVHINARAKAADASPDFSKLIRAPFAQ